MRLAQFLLLSLVLVLPLAAQAPTGQVPPATPPQPGAASPAPPAVTGYLCPMHPDIASATPGKCSRCGMDLVPGDPMATTNYTLRVTSEPRLVQAGRKTRFTFRVFHPLTGDAVKDFSVVHDRPYHLFVISRDLKHFVHEHPTAAADGSYSIELTLPHAGHYLLLSDFVPVGGIPQVLSTPVTTAGFDGDVGGSIPTLEPDANWAKQLDGTKVELKLEPSKLIAGEQIDLPFHFSDAASGTPVTDLQRYLGAFGHVLILSEDMVDHIHAHPHEMLEGTAVTSGGGPEVIFDAFFPRPGRYRVWLQFQRQDKLSTATFTFDVPRM